MFELRLIRLCFADLRDLSNGYLETKVDFAPGMKDVRLKDFPFIQTTDPDEVVFNFVIGAAETSVKARAIAVHTFDALEPEVLDGLSTIFPRVYSIGPLQLLLNQMEENGLKSIGYNLWKEDRECLQWLDTKNPKSVVYVNFGSITVMTADQLVEFAMGLANSKISFLWIIRPDLGPFQRSLFSKLPWIAVDKIRSSILQFWKATEPPFHIF
ncbi:hypothetical protein OIU77_018132 [Salix suchowensis]|uniref:Uncharacterized protein n=1 Tax=Salix suchowensis TaxID=1278906 RepID=A0ABQ8ZRC9_9ROSI|nr:hypothetical protein OIU77_018132 [Salix suchowensis]